MDKPDRWRSFCVASICREDLKAVPIADAYIDSLTDADMQAIAALMSDLYTDNGYWEDLRLCVTRFLFAREADTAQG